MVVLDQSEQIRARDGSSISLDDRAGLNSPTVSNGGSSRNGRVKSGSTPLSLPQPINISGGLSTTSQPTDEASTTDASANSNQPKLYGIIIALVVGAYLFFK